MEKGMTAGRCSVDGHFGLLPFKSYNHPESLSLKVEKRRHISLS